MHSHPPDSERFQIVAYMDTPLIMRGPMTLDALLMSLLGDLPVKGIIHSFGGLFFSSAAFFDAQSVTQPASFAASMHPINRAHEWIGAIKPNTRNGDVRIGAARKSEAGNVINTYQATGTSCIRWFGSGDAQAAYSALKNVSAIGLARKAGFGAVAHWAVEEGLHNGLIDDQGLPLRPIPVSMWGMVGGGDPTVLDLIPVEMAWRGPYWHPANRCACYAPNHLFMEKRV